MENSELYNIVDYILNKAGEKELEVVKEALKRRIENKNHSPMGIDINRMAHDAGSSLGRQVASSKDYIRDTVKDFVVRTIKQQAPEISERDLDVLIDQWVPAPGKTGKKAEGKQLPSDVIIKMIDQILRFSSGEMPLSEQAELNSSMPDWQENYWKHFPDKIRGLITLYLKGKIDSGTCWDEIKKELYSE